jgi:catechol 2,3-dioxygenase-like lactoylglutathione lyase family enzyme
MRRTKPVETFGLTHLALGVADPRRAFEFYRKVFGMVAVYRGADFIQAQTPGSRDVIVFERKKKGPTGRSGSIAHFGFRLTDPSALPAAIDAVKRAGGRLVDTGEFVPGEPYAFVKDRDGYLVEIWFEIPTPLDPKIARRRASRK